MLKAELLPQLSSGRLVLNTVNCLLSKSAWADYVTTPIQQKVLYPENHYQGFRKPSCVSTCEWAKGASSPQAEMAFPGLTSGVKADE